MVLTAFLSIALLCWHEFHSTGNRNALRLGYTMLALAVLAKGLVALLIAALIVGGFHVLEHHARRPIALGVDAWGFAVFLLLTLPWHIAVSGRLPSFPSTYFLNEHFLRFLGLRLPHDYYQGGMLYYLPRALAILFPWTLVATLATFRKATIAPTRIESLERFLVIWALAVFLLYTASQAKANYYIVQATPPLAALLALRLPRTLACSNTLLRVTATILCAGTCTMAAAFYIHLHRVGLWPDHYAGSENFVWIGAVLFAVIAAVAALAVVMRRMQLMIVSLTLLAAPMLALVLRVAVQAEPLISARPLAIYLRTAGSGSTIYLFRGFSSHSALAFYLPGQLRLIDCEDAEIAPGITFAKLATPCGQTGPLSMAPQARLLLIDERDRRLAEDTFPASMLAPLTRIGHVSVSRLATNPDHPLQRTLVDSAGVNLPGGKVQGRQR